MIKAEISKSTHMLSVIQLYDYDLMNATRMVNTRIRMYKSIEKGFFFMCLDQFFKLSYASYHLGILRNCFEIPI